MKQDMENSVGIVETQTMRVVEAAEPVKLECGKTLGPIDVAYETYGQLNEAGDNIDPEKALAVMLQGEKPGGHTERSIAVGTIEVALWDAVAKIEEKPLYRTIAERYSGGTSRQRMFVYVGGGWYAPGKGIPELLDEMRGYQEMGYTQLKMKVGGAALAINSTSMSGTSAKRGSA